MANAVSFLAIAFEKMIGTMIAEAMPLITDPEVAEEADGVRAPGGQHSMAHRQHAKGLIKSYPGLKETLDAVIAAFDDLTANKPLKYRLAYTADLEATFTPVFKLMLDNDATLFAPGDDRVASLFLWHFVEEVEHRSSALIIYDARRRRPLVPDAGGAVDLQTRHGRDPARLRGLQQARPARGRKVDAMSTFRLARRKKALLQRLPFADPPTTGRSANAFSHLPLREQLIALPASCAARSPATIRPTRSCPRSPTSGSPATTRATTSPAGTPPTEASSGRLMSDLCAPTFADLAARLGFSCDERRRARRVPQPVGPGELDPAGSRAHGDRRRGAGAGVRDRPACAATTIRPTWCCGSAPSPICSSSNRRCTFPAAFGIEDHVDTMFAHNVFTVDFLWGRLPLYIVAIYPMMATMAFEIVRSLGVFRRYGTLVGAVCVGFVHHAFYEIFDHSARSCGGGNGRWTIR